MGGTLVVERDNSVNPAVFTEPGHHNCSQITLLSSGSGKQSTTLKPSH